MKTIPMMIALALVLQPAAVRGDTIAEASDLFSGWAPLSITLDNHGRLVIALPQAQVSREMYLALVRAGLCFGPPRGMPLSGVREIYFLNRFAHSGWVLEGGSELCAGIAAARNSEVSIFGQTHQYSSR